MLRHNNIFRTSGRANGISVIKRTRTRAGDRVDEAILSGNPHFCTDATGEEGRASEREKTVERSEKRVARNEMIELPPNQQIGEVNRAGYPTAR